MSAYGAAILGGAINVGTTLLNNALAENREKSARGDNYFYGEMAANNADKRTRALYKDLQSPQAIMQQLKAAGLSPSLMYGGNMQGSVGQGAQGTGAAGVSPTTYGVNQLDAAQLELINAQTKKTEAEAKNIDVNTNKQQAEIDKIIEETKNEQLKQVYNELNNTLTQMDVNLKGTYAEEQIKADLAKTAAETQNLRATLESLIAEGKIKKESADAIIQFNKNRVLEQTADIMLKQTQARLAEANITLTKEQCQQILADIAFKEGIVDIGRQKVHVDRDKLNAQIEQWGKENGLRNKEANIQLAKVTADFIIGNGANAARALDALIPF